MYFSETNRHSQHKFTENGFKKTIDIYEELINEKTGKMEFKKTGEEPFYQKMQEETEGQLLETIIERYKINLNDRKITQLNDELVDMTTMPQDLIETYALAHKLEQQFEKSTSEIKNHFKDFAGYLKAFKDGTLKDQLEYLASKKLKNKMEIEKQKSIQTEQQTQNQNTNGGTINGQ